MADPVNMNVRLAENVIVRLSETLKHLEGMPLDDIRNCRLIDIDENLVPGLQAVESMAARLAELERKLKE